MLQNKKVLVVDDDIDLCEGVAMLFSFEDAVPISAFGGREALQKFYEHRPDLVILDINLPGMSGWEVCEQIRLMSDTPVIFLTTNVMDQEIVRGLDYGADDYVTKPFSYDVLIARARAVLRRSKNSQLAKREVFYDGHLYIDPNQRVVSIAGEVIKLSATEFKMLTFLMQNSGRILTYNQILDHVWGRGESGSVEQVHLYISHLRRKLKEAKSPRYLLTENNIGYRFSD